MAMNQESLKQRIQADMKASMKSGDKPRLGVIRLMMAAIKQQEVDERITLTDAQIIAVLDKMVKQRRESISQYRSAGREDLASAEEGEIRVIKEYLPEALTAEEIGRMIDTAVASIGAESIRDMGKVMADLKPQMQGRADMAEVSARVKSRLSSGG
jgi:uncharacterized protein